MEPVLIFGHRNPDTDSVCASISLSYLKNKLGLFCEPRVIGHLNSESKFVLKYFKVDSPKYLSDVKVQIKDLKFNRKALINENVSIDETLNFMIDKSISGIPVVDNKRSIKSYINLKDIVRNILHKGNYKLSSSYQNFIKVLDGKEITKFHDEISGNYSVVSNSKEKLKGIVIVVVEEREELIEYVINQGVQLIIVTGCKKIDGSLVKKAEFNNISIITTVLDIFATSNKMKLCNYLKTVMLDSEPYVVDRLEYLNDFSKKVNRLGHTNYPVVNNKNECVGMVTLKDLRDYEKKKVILVDHNEFIQSVEGIEEADILEVVDHHSIGSIGTHNPITIRMMPVGSTCTIIYTLYKENGIKIPKQIAGLMLSAIISDTLVFTSPTTTKMDVAIAEDLAKFCGINIKKFSLEMFKAGSSLKGKKVEEVLFSDYKEFSVRDEKVFITHIVSLDYDEINFYIDDYIRMLNNLTKKDYKYAILMVTDVTKNGSYILFSDSAKGIMEAIYDIKNIEVGTFIPGLMSRKKQLLPSIMDIIS